MTSNVYFWPKTPVSQFSNLAPHTNRHATSALWKCYSLYRADKFLISKKHFHSAVLYVQQSVEKVAVKYEIICHKKIFYSCKVCNLMIQLLYPNYGASAHYYEISLLNVEDNNRFGSSNN